MDIKIIGIAALRSSALVLEMLGRPRVADYLDTLANMAEAGVEIDAEMHKVADMLRDRSATEADWEALMNDLDQASRDLHAPRKGTGDT